MVTELMTKLGKYNISGRWHVPAYLILVDVIDRTVLTHAEVETIELAVVQHLLAELDWMLQQRGQCREGHSLYAYLHHGDGRA